MPMRYFNERTFPALTDGLLSVEQVLQGCLGVSHYGQDENVMKTD